MTKTKRQLHVVWRDRLDGGELMRICTLPRCKHPSLQLYSKRAKKYMTIATFNVGGGLDSDLMAEEFARILEYIAMGNGMES